MLEPDIERIARTYGIRVLLQFGSTEPTELRRLQLYAFSRYQNHQKYFDLERRFVAKAVTGAP